MDKYIEKFDSFSQKIICPVCNYDYVHFEEPIYKASNDTSGVAWDGRGDVIKIPMWCERDHKWELTIGFHKGNTFIFCFPDSPKALPFITEITNE